MAKGKITKARKEALRKAKQRIRYRQKQGYTFDINLEEMSTQALNKLRGKKLVSRAVEKSELVQDEYGNIINLSTGEVISVSKKKSEPAEPTEDYTSEPEDLYRPVSDRIIETVKYYLDQHSSSEIAREFEKELDEAINEFGRENVAKALEDEDDLFTFMDEAMHYNPSSDTGMSYIQEWHNTLFMGQAYSLQEMAERQNLEEEYYNTFGLE